jgi:hypothetical protein
MVICLAAKICAIQSLEKLIFNINLEIAGSPTFEGQVFIIKISQRLVSEQRCIRVRLCPLSVGNYSVASLFH